MARIIAWLFDTSMGVPGPAGDWPFWLSAVFHSANLVLCLCYLVIPVVKLAYWPYRGTGISSRQYWRIMAYMPMMALSRLVRVCEWWGPPYHLTTIVDAVAAGVTVYSFYHLTRLVTHIITLPSEGEKRLLEESLGRLLLRVREGGRRRAARAAQVGACLDRLVEVMPTTPRGYEALATIAQVRTLVDMSAHSDDDGEG